jgi:hypothetical protein
MENRGGRLLHGVRRNGADGREFDRIRGHMVRFNVHVRLRFDKWQRLGAYVCRGRLHDESDRPIRNLHGQLAAGFVSNLCSLDWDYTDVGNYFSTTTHRAYCTVASVGFILNQLRRQRPVSTPYCQDNQTLSTCADGNTEAPIGTLKSFTCKYYDQCCKAGGSMAPGWCRRETCAKCSGQSNDAKPSQCQSKEACLSNFPSLCLGVCQ